MKIPYYIIISFCFLSSTLTAQTYLFEDFNLGIPANWDIEYIGESTTNWTHNDGGALIGAYKFPPNAKEGNYNAFFRKEGNKGQKTRLITPLMDFTGGEKPMLKFWHAQAEWGVGTGDHENLRIFIKSANYDDWIQWEEYIDPVPSWTERNLFVPDSLISDSVYFAFEGETNFGAGLCIDSLVVYETGIIPYQLQESEYYQANTRFLTAGSDNNPLIYVNLKTYGNVGSLEMNRIAFDASSINSANIKINGAHLFHTTRPYFNTDTVIATDDLSGDSIVFNNLEYTLDFGDNYFWLALDIADDAIYGQSIDASFKSSGIDVSLDTTGLSDYSSVWISNDTVYYVIESDTLNGFINFDLPHSDISPDGDRKIKNTVFFDDFETDTNWTLNGDFEIAPPQGRGASDALGSPDPESAYDGDNILGTDLTGQGAKDGDYENNAAMYYAQLDFQDGFYFNDLYLSYNLWINKQSVDEGYIELSVDSGATWEKVRNYANYNRDYWEYDTVYLGNYNADQQKNIGVRFVMGPTSSVQAYSGWNVDNFAIAGNFIDKDVGITQIVEPYDECGHTTNDSIKVWLRNYAGIPVVDTTPIPIYYSLDDGDTKFYDTVYVNLGLVDSTLVTLNITANLIQPDIYNLLVATDLEGDEGPDNDDYSKAIYSFPTYTPGYTENFESNEGVFKNYGRNDKWQYGSFTGQMSPPPTGVKGWATGHGSNYNANDSSYLETGCYDFTGGGRHLVAFSFWMQTVTGEDGLNLQFSLDEGESWHLLDSNELGYNWDWFTDTVDALDEIGWSGDNGGWQTVRQLLPDSFNTEPKVKFRFHFKSKATSVTDNGVGIDNFRVYAAPKDIGVASVDSITDNCQYINPDQIWVTVQNYGLNKLEDGESIPVGYSINGPDSYSASDVDTIDLEADLLPGGKITYQFTSPVDISTPGNYSVKAYTMYEADPMFYFSNNDTSDLDFEILANPITGLQDTIQSKEPDTVVIRPKKDINYKYEWPPYPNVEDTFLVPSDGVYYVHVTDTGGNGCKTIDSVFVELLFNDAGIDSLISPITSCELGESEILTVNLYNFGTDSLISGEPVDIWFEMDDGPPQKQSFNLPEVIHRQASYSFDMTNYPLDLSTPGTYKFRMYTDIGGDTIASNDTTISYVTVHGYPDLDIGEDKTLEAYNYTLQAQSGYDQYLWDDGSTADSLVVDTSNWGNHWVTVTDTNNCASSDTAYVRLIVRDIIPKEIISPVSGCEIPGETTVTMKLENIGNDTIITDQQLYVSYRLNAGIRHIDTITLSGNLYPTAQYEHHFQVKGDFSIPDDYSFNVTATSYNDLTTSNDTINQLIVIDNNPDIDFGEDTNVFAYEYPLEATENANWNYVWKNDNGDELQNGPEHTYTARVSDQYHVIATDNSSGCSGGDTIQVTIKTRDLVAEGNNIPLVLCQGRSITPQLYVRQNGNFTLLSGSYIITYGIEEQSSFVDTATINNFAQGTVDTVTLKKSLVFDQTGSKSTFFDIDYEGDMNDTNDIHNKDIFVNTSPVVTLANGADTLTQELPVVLDAGSFEAYEWQDNSTNRTLNVTQPGDYSVTVTSNNGCQASDAIYVDALTSVSYASENLDEVSIYPVPASGTLTIKLSIRESMQPKAEIYDLRGKLLLRKELGDGNEIEKQLQLDELETGVYNLRIVDNQLLYQTNIIIAK